MGCCAMDQAAKDNGPGIFGDRKAQFWTADLLSSFHIHSDRHFQGDHPRV